MNWKWLRKWYWLQISKIKKYLKQKKLERIKEEEYRKVIRAQYEKQEFYNRIKREEKARIKNRRKKGGEPHTLRRKRKPKRVKDVWKDLEDFNDKINNMF